MGKRIRLAELVRQKVREAASEEPFAPPESQYRSPLWTLARAVKARRPDWHPEFAWGRVNEIVEADGGWGQWKFRAFRRAPGQSNAEGGLEPLGVEDLQAEFINAFEQCRLPTSDRLLRHCDG